MRGTVVHDRPVDDTEWWLKYEREHGCIRARLRVLTADEGGRLGPIFAGYRPDWNIGNLDDNGRPTINGAPLLIEGADEVPPGGEAVVRLHPLAPEFWTGVTVGQRIEMQEGPRVVAVLPPVSCPAGVRHNRARGQPTARDPRPQGHCGLGSRGAWTLAMDRPGCGAAR